MSTDNPADRLLDILIHARAYKGHYSCSAAWIEILDATSQSTLLARLARVIELPNATIQSVKDHLPNEHEDNWVYWSTQVTAAFENNNLSSTFDTFINYIDDHTIRYLRMTAALLSREIGITELDDETIQKQREALDKIMTEVLGSDIETDIKTYVVRSLRKIINSLDEYHLTGAIPILDSIDAMIGHSFPNKKYRKFLSEGLGAKVFNGVSTVANVITIATGLPQLTFDPKIALGFLSSP